MFQKFKKVFSLMAITSIIFVSQINTTWALTLDIYEEVPVENQVLRNRPDIDKAIIKLLEKQGYDNITPMPMTYSLPEQLKTELNSFDTRAGLFDYGLDHTCSPTGPYQYDFSTAYITIYTVHNKVTNKDESVKTTAYHCVHPYCIGTIVKMENLGVIN